MTEQAKKQGQRRRSLPFNKRRKQRVLLLALILILGSGAFLFYNEQLSVISEILVWLQQNKQDNIPVTTATAPVRGNIFDRNFRPLAATYETYAIYARPLEMDNPIATAKQLEDILGLERNELLPGLKSERGFVWIAKGIDAGLAQDLNARNIKGIYQVVETKRFYPHYETAAHAIGFVEDSQGLDGIEYQYNTLLRGDEINAAELEALHFDAATEFGQTTTNLVLDLDLMIQTKIEQFLEKRARVTGAVSGGALVMDANTGAILAMASYPGFNPNRYWEFSSLSLNNHLVSEPVYPGELALIFQEAAAINYRNQKIAAAIENTDGGAQGIPVIEPDILKRKGESGAPRIDYVDPEYLARFTQLLDFGQKPLTDIPLRNETPVSTAIAFTDPDFHTSALRLLLAFSALMNCGKIVSPHLLHTAYPKENPIPVVPVLNGDAQAVSLHPDTSNDLSDFLAARWLKLNGSKAQTPMFFETHRFAAPREDQGPSVTENGVAVSASMPQQQGGSQSVLLGAIPGRHPRLTMIALLTYPAKDSALSPNGLEDRNNKFSVLTPDEELVQKMLYLAEQPPPVPSPDFWTNSATVLAAGLDPHAFGKKDRATSVDNMKTMPDVTGKSLRAGLQVLQHFNLNIKVVGSGRIVVQHPAAGTELQDTTECILEMQQAI